MPTIEELLQSESVDVDAIRLASTEEDISSDQRINVWRHLLGISKSATPVRDAQVDEEQDRKIEADINLLNSTLTTPLDNDQCAELKATLHNLFPQYSSVLCEICGPLLEMKQSVPETCAFVSAIADRHLRYKFFSDTDSGLEACISSLLRLLLQYHDPLLSLHLDRYRVSPTILLKFWSNLFIHQIGMQQVYQLWDYLFLAPNPLSMFFFSLSLLVFNREAISQAEDTAKITETIEGLTCTPTILKTLFQDAKIMQRQTPPSSLTWLQQMISMDEAFNITTVSEKLQANIVLPITHTDLLEAFRVSV